MANWTDNQSKTLKHLLWRYPSVVSKGEGLHLSTVRTLEKEGLVKVDTHFEFHWSKPRRDSDATWSAELTDEGIQEALRLGFVTHSDEECDRHVKNICGLHTKFLENRIPVPTLWESTPEDLGKPVLHTRTGQVVGYLKEGKFLPVEKGSNDT